jgi:hypothetical protein
MISRVLTGRLALGDLGVVEVAVSVVEGLPVHGGAGRAALVSRNAICFTLARLVFAGQEADEPNCTERSLHYLTLGVGFQNPATVADLRF